MHGGAIISYKILGTGGAIILYKILGTGGAIILYKILGTGASWLYSKVIQNLTLLCDQSLHMVISKICVFQNVYTLLRWIQYRRWK